MLLWLTSTVYTSEFFFMTIVYSRAQQAAEPGLEKAVPFAGHPVEEKCADTVR